MFKIKKLKTNDLSLKKNEEKKILNELSKVSIELKTAQLNFEAANNVHLIDSFSYEILSLQNRFDYYVKMCKEMGVIAEGFKKAN